MNYQQCLDYLYGLQRFGIKLGLENIRALLASLGHPERGYGILHVGGTNGKGSVSACLAEILRVAGYRVGLYTSPHLHSFTERIRVDGTPIEEAEVARLTGSLLARAEGVPTTFFEFTTALALHYFRLQKVDFAVIEVGMGGRLDATNAVTPLLSVITPVSRDHAEHLGADLVSIAREKGGIIKPGIPVAIGVQEPEVAAALLEAAEGRRSPALVAGRDFLTTAREDGFDFRSPGLELAGLRPTLAGRHQQHNLSLALAAAGILRRQGVAIAEAALRKGVERVAWPGRLEWWEGGREVLLDGAHNVGGAVALADYLGDLPLSGVRWVVGIKGDKVPGDILGPVLPLVNALYCTAPPVEEAVSPAELARLGAMAGVPAKSYAKMAEALAAALIDRRPGEIVLVAGSLFLVAAAREFLRCRQPSASPTGQGACHSCND